MPVGVAEGCPWGLCRSQLRGASEFRRIPSPGCRPSGRAVGVRRPRAVSEGVRDAGAQHCLLSLHALSGLRAGRVVGGRSWGGRPSTVVRGVWCQALSLPRPPVLWAGQPGFRDP